MKKLKLELPNGTDRGEAVKKGTYLTIKTQNLMKTSLCQGWIKIRKLNKVSWLKPSDICYCRAERCYVHIFLKSGDSHVRCDSLKNLEARLQQQSFFRCHRSFLVNMDEVIYVDFEGQNIHQKLYQIPFSKEKTADLLSEWIVRIKKVK